MRTKGKNFLINIAGTSLKENIFCQGAESYNVGDRSEDARVMKKVEHHPVKILGYSKKTGLVYQILWLKQDLGTSMIKETAF